MYGSDIATIDINRPVAWLKQTSEYNLRMLRPGSEFVVAMDNWGGQDLCLCIAGYGAFLRLQSASFWGNVLEHAYDRGLRDSDGAVPVSSALLEGAEENRTFRRDHGTIAITTYMKDDQYPLPAAASTLEELLGLLLGGTPCTNRRAKTLVYTDEIYISVRDYISSN